MALGQAGLGATDGTASLGVVFRSTMAALRAPRRAFPITVVVVPLLFLQFNYSDDPLALPLAILMCATFLLFAPTLWRALFPQVEPQGSAVTRAAVYGVVGAILVVGVGRGLPAIIGMGRTFLTTRPSLLVSVALFWVGGWGLARDIDLEANLRREQARSVELEREAEHAQLLALRSHLDPHFLFNTLNAIAEWCRADGAVAERAILQLSDMLRTVMTGIRITAWPLAREIELIDNLLSLHLIRDPELFVYKRDIPADLPDVRVPPMILLPVIENAMKHGPAAGNRGDVRVSIRVEKGSITIEIDNPGPFRGPREGGHGLPIIQKRLALSYRHGASFVIAAHGERTLATIVLPVTGALP